MSTMLRASMLALLTAAIAPAGACDSKATASDPVAASPSRLSREGESCGATTQCAEGHRCLEQTCEREARSTVGDFLAARGARALAGGDVAGAIKAYNEAAAAYEQAKLTVPPDLDCALGQALVGARGQKDKLELAARILHRCLLASPPGGKLRATALTALTELDRSGFDPQQLARPELADLYLTAGPIKPAAADLVISIGIDPRPARGKTWSMIEQRLGQAEVKDGLVKCWDAHYDARQERTLVVRTVLSAKYIPSDYEDEPGRFSASIEPTASMPEAAAAALPCVKAALAGPLGEVKGRDTFTGTLVISVK
jgi:hypothetical protein